MIHENLGGGVCVLYVLSHDVKCIFHDALSSEESESCCTRHSSFQTSSQLMSSSHLTYPVDCDSKYYAREEKELNEEEEGI